MRMRVRRCQTHALVSAHVIHRRRTEPNRPREAVPHR